MNDRMMMWIFIQFGTIIFLAGGVYFTVKQLRREVSAIWLNMKAQRRVNTKTLLALQALAQTGNPHPNQDALALCKEIASINGD